MWIVDLDNLQNYLDITPKKFEQDEFLSNDPITGVYANNSLVNVVPALRNANQTSLVLITILRQIQQALIILSQLTFRLVH